MLRVKKHKNALLEVTFQKPNYFLLVDTGRRAKQQLLEGLVLLVWCISKWKNMNREKPPIFQLLECKMNFSVHHEPRLPTMCFSQVSLNSRKQNLHFSMHTSVPIKYLIWLTCTWKFNCLRHLNSKSYNFQWDCVTAFWAAQLDLSHRQKHSLPMSLKLLNEQREGTC